MKPWKTLDRRTVFEHKPWLTVERHTVELPDGRVIPDWQWVITPDYVNVVAIAEDGAFLCFRQVKYAIEGPTLALIGGFLESGEEPLAAAKRELLEETGCEAPDWLELGHFQVDPSRGVAIAHFYLARRVRQVAAPTGGDLEEQHLLRLSREQMEKALNTGEFKVLAWSHATALALRALGNEEARKSS